MIASCLTVFPHVNKLWGSDPQYILRGEMYWGSDPGLKFWRRWGRLLRFQINPQGMCDAPPTKDLSGRDAPARSEEHTSELQSRPHIVCRLLLEKKNWLCLPGKLAVINHIL